MLRARKTAAAAIFLLALLAASPPRSSTGLTAYPLSKQNGPWMIVVKSFVGPQAVEMADKLVEELRDEHGITAYTWVQSANKSLQGLQGVSLRGRVRQYDNAAVLAGDFDSESAREATKLRDKIRAIRPKCIPADATSKYRYEEGALTTAWIAPNPLRPPPAKDAKPDPLLLKMNTGKASLYNCRGDYTLKVLEFNGAVAVTPEQEKQLGKHGTLQKAGEDAEQITEVLARQGFDAYVFHGLYASIVTVGSFTSPQDPQIDLVRKQMAGIKVGSFTLSQAPLLIAVPKR